VSLRRAVLVDRDPLLLSRLTGELSRRGYVVESLSSVVGLTPDLLALSNPDFLLLDAELPGVKPAALLVIIRSLRARRQLKIAVSTSGDPAWMKTQLQPDALVLRKQLLREGELALGIAPESDTKVDVRGIVDEVLGQKSVGNVQALEVKINLFSKGNFYVGKDNQLGIFIPTAALLAVGQKVEIHLDLMESAIFSITGEVAWQRSHSSFGGGISSGIGINPLEIPAEHRAAIDKFVETRQPITWAA